MPIVLAFFEISWVFSITCPGGTIAIRLDHSTMTEDPHVQDKHLSLKTRNISNIFQPIAIFDSRRVSTPLYSLSMFKLRTTLRSMPWASSVMFKPFIATFNCLSLSKLNRAAHVAWHGRHQSTQSDQNMIKDIGWCQNPPTTILPGATLFPKDTEA